LPDLSEAEVLAITARRIGDNIDLCDMNLFEDNALHAVVGAYGLTQLKKIDETKKVDEKYQQCFHDGLQRSRDKPKASAEADKPSKQMQGQGQGRACCAYSFATS